jgi:hypothetical protein
MEIALILLVWPGVVLASAVINMLIWSSFSWSELILDYLIGVTLGLCYVMGVERNAGPIAHFFLVMSHGLAGVLFTFHAFDKDVFLWVSAIMTVGSTIIAAALDRAAVALGKTMSPGTGLFSSLIFLFKLPFTLVTSAVSMLFFLVGAIRSAGPNGRVGFIAGVFYVEWNTASATTSATTLGWCVQVWQGKFECVIEHELYHSRQYIYLRDWLIPAWIVGGIWGIISSAIAGETSLLCFQAAKFDREVGNPIERAAYGISGYNGPC